MTISIKSQDYSNGEREIQLNSPKERLEKFSSLGKLVASSRGTLAISGEVGQCGQAMSVC